MSSSPLGSTTLPSRMLFEPSLVGFPVIVISSWGFNESLFHPVFESLFGPGHSESQTFKLRPSIEARRSPPRRALTRAASDRCPEKVLALDSPAGPGRPRIEILHAQCSAYHRGAEKS